MAQFGLRAIADNVAAGHSFPSGSGFDALDPRFYKSHVYWQSGTFDGIPDRATLRARIQPIADEVLDDLVKSGDLDPAVRAKMPVIDVGDVLEWTPSSATASSVDDGTCITKTSLNFAADKFPAPVRTKCAP